MSLAGELVVLGTEENSSMVSTWKEFVCLQRLSDARFELSVRGYEVLGEASGYRDEETGEYHLPSEIDGSTVVGVEDEYVVGGSLVPHSDDRYPLVFSSIRNEDDKSEIQEWLRSVAQVQIDDYMKRIRSAIRKQ
jgi:hypothetical protein